MLEQNYRINDPENMAAVWQVYDDIKLKKMVSKDIDQHREEMIAQIQHISALRKDTFFQILFSAARQHEQHGLKRFTNSC